MSSGSSRRRSATAAHEWTDFEMHTLLCLMAKGTHLEGRANRNDEEGAAKRNAYLDLATKLNKAVHCEDYVNDIDKKDITNMVDKMLVERKSVVGKGGYMERSTHPRITRGLKMAWERSPAIDFDGSLSEWKLWRKESEAEKERVRNGGLPTSTVNSDSDENVQGQSQEASATQNIQQSNEEDFWRQADVAQIMNASKWRSSKTQTSAPTTGPAHYFRESMLQIDTGDGRDGFESIPSKLRSTDAFSWALPHASSNMESYRQPRSSSMTDSASDYPLRSVQPMINSYRPSDRSSMTGPSNHPSEYSSRSEQPDTNTYRPAVPLSREFDSYRSSRSQLSTTNSSPRMLKYLPHEARSTPSLTHDYSSSPNKLQSPYSARPIPSSILTAMTDDALAKSVNSKTSQRDERTSSQLKKPGVRKHADKLRADKTINPARQAMLNSSLGDVEMGEAAQAGNNGGRQRSAGKGANKEKLPFNRLNRMRSDGGNAAMNMEMDDGYSQVGEEESNWRYF